MEREREKEMDCIVRVSIQTMGTSSASLTRFICSLYCVMSSKLFRLFSANTSRKPSPVRMYWSRIALHNTKDVHCTWMHYNIFIKAETYYRVRGLLNDTYEDCSWRTNMKMRTAHYLIAYCQKVYFKKRLDKSAFKIGK